MLRRPPTLITLTPDDIAAYESNRAARLQAQAQAKAESENGPSSQTPSGSCAPQSRPQALLANGSNRAKLNPRPTNAVGANGSPAPAAAGGNGIGGNGAGAREREEEREARRQRERAERIGVSR